MATEGRLRVVAACAPAPRAPAGCATALIASPPRGDLRGGATIAAGAVEVHLSVPLGQAKEQLLERSGRRHERHDRDARLDERDRQLGHRTLVVGGEQDAALGARPDHLGDAGLRRAHAPRALVVGRAQTVALAGGAQQRVERALVDHATGAHDRDAVAQLLDLAHQVRGQQHGHALVGEPAHEHPHVAHAGRVEPGRRLVEQQQARRAQQRGGDPEPLLHAVRVALDLVALAVGEVDRVERGVDARVRVAAVERGHQLEVPAAAQVRVEARRLDEARDAVERRRALPQRIAAEQPGDARVGRISPSSIRSEVVLPAPLGPR